MEVGGINLTWGAFYREIALSVFNKAIKNIVSNIAGQVSLCQMGREGHRKVSCYDNDNILWQQRLQLLSK